MHHSFCVSASGAFGSKRSLLVKKMSAKVADLSFHRICSVRQKYKTTSTHESFKKSPAGSWIGTFQPNAIKSRLDVGVQNFNTHFKKFL